MPSQRRWTFDSLADRVFASHRMRIELFDHLSGEVFVVATELNFVELTVMDTQAGRNVPRPPIEHDCCLVQIYPTDVVDGLQKVEQPVAIIGRDATCDIALDDANVSRQHARLERVDGGYLLYDLQSTNGTFVNEVPITEHRLTGGECLRFGSFIFKFLSADCLEAQYHETVYNAMTRDGLTHAFNKSYLLDSLTYELARSRRNGRPLSIVMLDIDHFKSVNDTHGHLVGDEVLKEFSRRLQEVSRADDLLCRYGGEEFVLVLSDTDLEEAVKSAERCRLAITSEPFETAVGPLAVTTSLGAYTAALLPDDGTTTDLIRCADEQLYRAKRTGRNRVCVPDTGSSE